MTGEAIGRDVLADYLESISWSGRERAERIADAAFEYARSRRGAESDSAVAATDDTARGLPAAPGQARDRTGADLRESLGRIVREAWVAWAHEQPDIADHPFWTVPWDELTGRDREVDMRIGEAVAAAERERDAEDRAAAEANIARLGIRVDRLGREHARHALAVSVHKGRADQQESRAVRAEKQLARFASHAEEYDRLAEQAAESQRNADLVVELRRRIKVLERCEEPQLPLSATCTGPDCGTRFTDSETEESEFASRERMNRLLNADGWQVDPVLCPACQPGVAS